MLKRLLPRPWGEVNKRGQILLIFGFIWVIIGVNVYIEPDPAGWEHIWMFREIPRSIRAGGWIVTGGLAMAYALRPRWIDHDGLGFLALYMMPAERAAGMFWGWFDYLLPVGGPGYSRGLMAGCVYLVIVAAVLVVSSWPNPPTSTSVRGES